MLGRHELAITGHPDTDTLGCHYVTAELMADILNDARHIAAVDNATVDLYDTAATSPIAIEIVMAQCTESGLDRTFFLHAGEDALQSYLRLSERKAGLGHE